MSDDKPKEPSGSDLKDAMDPIDDTVADDPNLDLDQSLDLEDWKGDEGWEDEEEDTTVLDRPQFVDNGDDTISDARSHLMWRKDDSFHQFGYGINWFEANDYIEELNEKTYGGFDDWRLCSFDEAKTLFSFTISNRDKDGAEIHIDPIFEAGGGHNTWTYEEKPDYGQYAMIFNFITGNEKWEHKDNEYCHVRAVRDEIKEEWEPEWRKKTRKFGD